MARRGRGQFQFTVMELSVLAASFTVTSVLVFFLGLYVGRELAAQHGGSDQRVARVPVSETPPTMPAPRPIPLPDVDPAAAAEQPTIERPKPAAQVPKAPAKPPVAASAPAAAQTAPRPRDAAVLPPGVLPSRDDPDRVRQDAEPERPAAAQPGAPYTVQVLATRNRKEADALIADLKGRGFGAFVTPVEDTGGKWYRVRIGRYDDPQAARAMADRCKRELGLSQAYVSPF